eukprot:CAMPEP_0114619492 /NCGR_PEP_ID=MMETSP0168-20121206/8241_1 /TAXON_ID=95228 ORGANISM="Vannella sp., Strain DIVA3 517/6/12" /NCGR_SAMPLE_ID=MMETSP0168 /ASSEMBLY_ACC=CAM_ASM_000044 /LENGTH=139 /DNA_ID=CAMNT_0001830661 /DNA_START=62 /DNA_END=481 /DNA_ORIENTATION=+
MIYTLYIFNRLGNCSYYKEWLRKNKAANMEEEYKLIYGYIFQLKHFCSLTSPTKSNGSFNYFTTDSFKLHYFESPTSIKFILMTDPAAGDMREQLRQIYDLYVMNVAKNPLYELNETIECEAFDKALDDHVKALPQFSR